MLSRTCFVLLCIGLDSWIGWITQHSYDKVTRAKKARPKAAIAPSFKLLMEIGRELVFPFWQSESLIERPLTRLLQKRLKKTSFKKIYKKIS